VSISGPASHSLMEVCATLSFALALAAALLQAARLLPQRIDAALADAPHPQHRRRGQLLVFVSPIFALACLYAFPSIPVALGATVFVLVLLTLAWIDAETGLLPDLLTLPLLWLGLLVNIPGAFVSLPDAVIGAVAGYLVLFCVYWAFLLCAGREGLGQGDLKLMAALGAWSGWMSLPWVLLVSATLGLLVALVLRARGRLEPGQALSFGPCLAAAGILVLFAQPGLR